MLRVIRLLRQRHLWKRPAFVRLVRRDIVYMLFIMLFIVMCFLVVTQNNASF